MKAKNVSGGPVHFPAVGRDVDDGEVVEVPDDITLPAEYFEPVARSGRGGRPLPSGGCGPR